jgi:hypothetical protein
MYKVTPTSTLTSIGRFNCVHFSNLDIQGGRYSNDHRTPRCPLHRTSENDHPFDVKTNFHRVLGRLKMDEIWTLQFWGKYS